MKKLNGIINIILIAAVAILFVLHFQEAASPEESMEKQEVKVVDANNLPDHLHGMVYINQDSLQKKSKVISSKIEYAQKRIQVLDQEYQQLITNFERDRQAMSQKAQSVNAFEQSKIQVEFNQKANQVAQEEQRTQQKLVEIQTELQTEIKTSIENAVKTLNLNENYSYVLFYSDQVNLVMPIDNSLDVTQLVIDQIDLKQ